MTRTDNNTGGDTKALIATHRLALADGLDALDEAAWTTQSLCDAWQVRHVAGHLLLSSAVPAPKFLFSIIRHRGYHSASRELSIELGNKPKAQLLELMRDKAEVINTPPGLPVEAALADLIVHIVDMFAPIDRTMPVDEAAMRTALDFVMTKKGAAYRPSGGLGGLRFEATDLDWSSGTGPVVTGSSWDLVSTMYGRPALLVNLTGDGQAEFRSRL